MRAAVFREYGPPDVLGIEDVPKPVLRNNEVLIRVRAATVTMGDCEIRTFTFPPLVWLPLRLMFGVFRPRVRILGQEFSGEIEAVGGSVTRFKPGDRVFGPSGASFGAYADYKCMKATSPMSIIPPEITFEEAATISMGLDSLHFLRKADIQSGEEVLINGAAGSIGHFAVQIAKHLGAEVTGVDGSDKLDMVREAGADHVIDYTREDFTKSGRSWDVIFDVVGKGSFSRGLRALKPRGRHVSANPELNRMVGGLWASMTTGKKVITGLATYGSEHLDYLGNLMGTGTTKAFIDRRYPLEEIVEAHRYVEAGHKKGDVVITFD